MSELAEVWHEVEKLLKDGLSVIPVRDKDEVAKDGKTYARKTPYYKWKDYQSKRYTKDELWKAMDYRNTSAISIICGAISGNLEVIDIDSKWKDDAAILLFAAIKEFDQRLFDILRIHKTPSGGYHILYKIENPPDADLPGNTKLAGRNATDEELAQSPKNKVYNFLETRGNGGYVLAPPSMGYQIHKDNPIPLITWEQRNNLINISKTFDTIIKTPSPVYKQTVKDERYYDESPWEDYNRNCDPVELMERNGWMPERTVNAHNIYFTRPGKTTGISMSFRQDIRKFYCFTSTSEFEPDTAYTPISILLKLEFNDDKKRLYSYLISNGYGRVKPKVEQNLAVSLAKKNKPIPANFSQEAVILNKQTIDRLKEDHPYGVFIKYSIDDEKLAVSRESLLYVANNLGFRYNINDESLVRIVGNFIFDIAERDFQDVLKGYMRDEDPDSYEELCNIYEAFMQKNGSYMITRLELLDTSLILKDQKDVCYKYYKNGYLTITVDEIEFNQYEDNDLLIWDHSIQKRNYQYGDSGVYIDFIKKAVQYPDNAELVLGYLAHEYKDETSGFIIVLTETCADPKAGGGSGKNVFCNLLKLTTSYISKPGAQVTFDEKFFQSWNYQKVFGISDLPKNFDFEFLKEPTNGEFILKKLFKDEKVISCEDGMKFIVQTNYSFEVTDGGLKRRIIPLEFTDFFTRAGGLDVHYNKHFPNQWDETDFAGFDTYIAQCVQLWLRAGRKLVASELTDTGKHKQWIQQFGLYATTFILNNIEQWQTDKKMLSSTFKSQLDAFIAENNIPSMSRPSLIRINSALEAHSKLSGYEYDKERVIKDSMNVSHKYKIFLKDGETLEYETPF